MDSINIIRKLTSRKFWAMLAGLITNILILYNFPDNEITQIAAIIGAVGSIICYIFAEAFVDAKHAENPVFEQIILPPIEFKEEETTE